MEKEEAFQSRTIETDSDAGKKLGFTSDLYEGVLYQYDEKCIYVFLVHCTPHNFKELIARLMHADYIVCVITALPEWEYYCQRMGMTRKISYAKKKYSNGTLRSVTMEI